MELRDLLLRNRSYRRFEESERIPEDLLREWVALAALCPSGRNAQPLRYRMVSDPEGCAEVFPHLAWAGYLTEWPGPEAGERPVAYLVQLLDTRIVENCLCDDGIQAQSILLGAVESGYGGCIIKAFKESALRPLLELPDYYRMLYVIALGKPKEKVVLEKIEGNDFKYWRGADGVHHVPKRPVDDLIV